jgi:hypothetical protein
MAYKKRVFLGRETRGCRQDVFNRYSLRPLCYASVVSTAAAVWVGSSEQMHATGASSACVLFQSTGEKFVLAYSLLGDRAIAYWYETETLQ